jgi:peptidoglycan/LPS O-acetylase OafA/YrhL
MAGAEPVSGICHFSLGLRFGSSKVRCKLAFFHVEDALNTSATTAALNRTLQANQVRYSVLDALRFFLALWVTMGHFRIFPLFAGIDETTRLGRFLVHGWSSVVFGTPAVIGFFVISGFCIHLPFRGQEHLLVGHYYARRYSRILIPLVGALIVFRLVGMPIKWLGRDSIIWHSMLWSLLCEEIYYAIYPLIRIARRHVGWKVLLPATFLISLVISESKPFALDWNVYGPIGTAFLLFPVWLLGCVLAEQSDSLEMVAPAEMWAWRFAVWAGSWVCEMLHFKTKIHTPHTMVLFGVLAYFWIRKELAYSKYKAPWSLLASAGAWSYSLYLIHPAAMSVIGKLQLPSLGYLTDWFAAYALILGMSYSFYLFVERPSHRMARQITVIRKREVVSTENAALPHAV